MHTDDDLRRHTTFLCTVVALGAVWVLAHRDDPDCWATSQLERDDVPGGAVPVVPVWSSEAAARPCAHGPWSDYRPQRIGLDDFVELALQGLHEQGVLVGTDWNADLHGHDLGAAELAHALAEVMTSASR